MAENAGALHESQEEPLFLGLIGNLQVSGFMHLGKMADPATGEAKRDLSAAKGTIDLLRMLRRKTEGNLADGERNLLDHVIFELELNYVDESQKKEKDPTDGDSDNKDAANEANEKEEHVENEKSSHPEQSDTPDDA